MAGIYFDDKDNGYIVPRKHTVAEKTCINFVRAAKTLVAGGIVWGGFTGMSSLLSSNKDDIIADQIKVIQNYKDYAIQPAHDSIEVIARATYTNIPNNPFKMKVATRDVIAHQEETLQTLRNDQDPVIVTKALLDTAGQLFGVYAFVLMAAGTLAYRKERQLSDHLGTKLYQKLRRSSPAV